MGNRIGNSFGYALALWFFTNFLGNIISVLALLFGAYGPKSTGFIVFVAFLAAVYSLPSLLSSTWLILKIGNPKYIFWLNILLVISGILLTIVTTVLVLHRPKESDYISIIEMILFFSGPYCIAAIICSVIITRNYVFSSAFKKKEIKDKDEEPLFQNDTL